MRHDDESLAALAAAAGAELLSKRWRLATAESCTGGWIAKVITDVAGASHWFDSAVVTYSNAAKIRDLGVSATIIDEHGAVSGPVVEAMAEGLRARSGCEAAIAVSGIAGPHGGTVEKPVGCVWFAWSVGDRRVTETSVFPGNREAIRRATVAHALVELGHLIQAAST